MHSAEKTALDEVVKRIIAAPALGGFLGIQVYKYKVNRQQDLLAYCFVEGLLFSPHPTLSLWRGL